MKKVNSKPPLSDFFVSKSGSSKIQELRIGLDVGGKRNPASGAFQGMKGDVESKLFLIEAKKTGKDEYRLSRKVVSKIDKEAIACGKIPAIVVEFENMRRDVESRWALIPFSVLAKIARRENGKGGSSG